MRFVCGMLGLLSLVAHAQSTRPTDSYLWLEDSSDVRTTNWVQSQNLITENVLKSDPRFAAAKAESITLLTADDKLPLIQVNGEWAYNFWQDKNNKRGIWRRTKMSELSKTAPMWDTILDVDALAASEKEDWYWTTPVCLPPAYTVCLVNLSRGGKDAKVAREFDVTKKQFVAKGFFLPEAKSTFDWVDHDTLVVATDFGPDTLTTSGYPAQIRLVKRGQDLASAQLLMKVKPDDLAANPSVSWNPKTGHVDVYGSRQIDFFAADNFWLDPNGKFQPLHVPSEVSMQVILGDNLLFQTLKDWTIEGHTIRSGVLLSVPLKKLLKPVSFDDVEFVFQPGPGQTFDSVSVGRDTVFVFSLDNVRGRLTQYRRSADGKWTGTTVAVPDNGALAVVSAEPASNDLYFRYASFLTPTSILKIDGTHPNAAPQTLLRSPARFDASLYTTEQIWSTSKDGTKVPYFIVHPKNMKADGENPVLMTGYGGFNYSEVPFYSSVYGKLWLEKGGSIVVANIRGGGEFGPAWHDAAIRENRQRAYDDFIGVAEDLISRKITSPSRLAIEGGSNGGLLVGTVAVERHDLFGAVLCQVPLLDMVRYTHIDAGASWMAEYGDPDNPTDLEFILKYSPYQNVKPDVKYPRIYFQTATSDDRVSPVHARKMAAKMLDQGHSVLFHETQAGGHTGTSDYEAEAEDYALDYVYLYQQILGTPVVLKAQGI